MKIDENLASIFDLEPINYKEVKEIKPALIVSNNSEKVIDNDYQNVRDNLYDLLETGKEALLDMLEVAKQSENPRAYEVTGNLIKQLADMNQQLLDIHQQKQKLDAPNKKEQTGNVTTNNAIFVGSTNDLSKFLNNMNSEK
jgi:hypothetical protein